jgi:hypothetical protein
MMLKLMRVMMGCMVMSVVPAMAAEYYSVAVDVASQQVIESVWQEMQAPTAWAPQSLEHLMTRGALLILPKEDLIPKLTWEMDLGVLHPDGNIMHLLGTATVSEVSVKAKQNHATITADLFGVQVNDCRARLSAIVDVGTRSLVMEKFMWNCLGREVAVATALHPKD